MIDLQTNISTGANTFCLKSRLSFWLHPARLLQQLRCFVQALHNPSLPRPSSGFTEVGYPRV